MGLSSPSSPEITRNEIERLTGEDRLDASAIKNLPVGQPGSVSAAAAISFAEQSSAPTSGSNALNIFADTSGNLSVVASVEDGGRIRELTRSRRFATITTSAIGNGVSSVGAIPLAPAFVLHSVSLSANARIRIYQTNAQLLADADRVSTVAPTGNHGLIFEAIGSGLIQTQFTVIGANKESIPTANLPISITNQSGASSAFTIAASFTPLED